MSQEKKQISLPLLLLIGIAIGVGSGLFLPEKAMAVVVTLKYIINQLIMFCVPIIIIGFIAPSITKMGNNATKILGISVCIAYVSTVIATAMSMTVGYVLIPNLPISKDMESLKTLPELVFQLDIPQIMPVMSALVISILIGLSAVWSKADTITNVLIEFQSVVLNIVQKIVIPVLPLYIALCFCSLSYDGTITKQFPAFLLAIIIVIVLHYVWLAVLYLTAGAYSGKNPLEVIKHYGGAYLTAVGTMSSAATLSVSLDGARKSKVLRSDLVEFAIPLFANIHLCGSALTETFFVMLVSKVLYGQMIPFGSMILFILLLAIFAIGAPGVPGGTVMASLGLVTGVLGFNAEGTALVLAIFALQDSFGTACNVTGDGALTLFLTGYAEKHGLKAEDANK